MPIRRQNDPRPAVQTADMRSRQNGNRDSSLIPSAELFIQHQSHRDEDDMNDVDLHLQAEIQLDNGKVKQRRAVARKIAD